MLPLIYTSAEVAAMSGVALSVVQMAVTTGRIPAGTNRDTHRRELDGSAILAFALVQALPQGVRVSVANVYRQLDQSHLSLTNMTGELIIGDLVRIDAEKALAPVRRRIRLYERARDLIVSDPELMGGSPTIRGTRITAQAIASRMDAGDTIADILNDYPYVDQESVEAAAIYTKANPPRGRPVEKPSKPAS